MSPIANVAMAGREREILACDSLLLEPALNAPSRFANYGRGSARSHVLFHPVHPAAALACQTPKGVYTSKKARSGSRRISHQAINVVQKLDRRAASACGVFGGN